MTDHSQIQVLYHEGTKLVEHCNSKRSLGKYCSIYKTYVKNYQKHKVTIKKGTGNMSL